MDKQEDALRPIENWAKKELGEGTHPWQDRKGEGKTEKIPLCG